MKLVNKTLCLTIGTLAVNLALLLGCAPATKTLPFESVQMKGVEPVAVAVDAAARRLDAQRDRLLSPVGGDGHRNQPIRRNT